MNLPKRSSSKSVLTVYTRRKILLWIKSSYFSLENACYSWCMHQTGFSKASGHKVNLQASCEAQRLLCHRVNLPSCVARRPLFHKVNLTRYEARRHHFIMTCVIFSALDKRTFIAKQVQKLDRINSDRQSAGQSGSDQLGSTRIE